jgi:MarR family transcriptional regulator, negative regulator of the multidrug operon emrRAB
MHERAQPAGASRLANLFGAASLAATGAMTAAAAAVTDGGLSAAAALVTLAGEPGIGVTELGRRLGLSQPGATRLVGTLANRGLVRSYPEPGGRTVALRLTETGGQKARLILAERERALAAMLAPLGEEARRDLDAALTLVLERLTDEGAPAHRTCRLCDEQACTAAACPVGQAWRRAGQPC